METKDIAYDNTLEQSDAATYARATRDPIYDLSREQLVLEEFPTSPIVTASVTNDVDQQQHFPSSQPGVSNKALGKTEVKGRRRQFTLMAQHSYQGGHIRLTFLGATTRPID